MQQPAQNARRFHILLAASLDLHREIAEVRHLQRLQQQAAVGVGIHAHAQLALGRNLRQIAAQLALRVEQLLRLVAAHPLFQHPQVIGFFAQLAQRHLVRAPRVLHRLAVDELRSRPALGRAQNDHGPGRPRDPFAFVSAARAFS